MEADRRGISLNYKARLTRGCSRRGFLPKIATAVLSNSRVGRIATQARKTTLQHGSYAPSADDAKSTTSNRWLPSNIVIFITIKGWFMPVVSPHFSSSPVGSPETGIYFTTKSLLF